MIEALDGKKDRLLREMVALAGDAGHLGTLALQAYQRAAAEDLVRYQGDELVALAATTLASLQRRTPGTALIRVYDPEFPTGGREHRQVTVIEIINDNMPFLVDSTMQELADSGFVVRLLVHPIIPVLRDRDGIFSGFAAPTDPKAIRESVIEVHVQRLAGPTAREELTRRLTRVMDEVRAAVNDWPAMRARVDQVIKDYRSNPPPLPVGAIAEAIELLTFLARDNFVFIGLRDYDLSLEDGEDNSIALRAESGLGVLRDPDVRVLRRGKELVQVTPEIREFMRRPEALIVTKANVKARVHRRAHMDYIGVKRFDGDGRLTGEMRIVGLFTATAYTQSVKTIPYLRHKTQRVTEQLGFDPESHSGKTLSAVLESYPRDDLFQIDEATLVDFARTIVELGERPRVRVLARRDKFDRFVSILVYVPRDRYTTDIRLKLGDYLKKVYHGRLSAFYPDFPEGTLARVHFIIGRDGGDTPNPSRSELEAAVSDIILTWTDRFDAAAHQRLDSHAALRLIERYRQAFPANYRDVYLPDEALDDITSSLRLKPERPTTIQLRQSPGMAANSIGLKLFHLGGAVPLSDRVPVLEAMGFQVIAEQSFTLLSPDGAIALHDMQLITADGTDIDLTLQGAPLQALFMAVWLGDAESDRLNALVLSARLGWREVALLRALSRYLQQAGIAFDQAYIAGALNRHPLMAAALVRRFDARFSPTLAGDRAAAEREASADIDRLLNSVSSLDDDAIFRRLSNLIAAASRTNFYAIGPKGTPAPTLSIKLDPARVDGLPAPRPFAEIWVYSPRVEGVHLRFGKVARGGLRWSDRPQDFRTEVLGLVKAQQVKNAVIVPVGAKGGFFPKKLPKNGSRDAVFQEGTAAYKLFVSALLELTDNIVDDSLVPPAGLIRHDGDDPYLVVAADKGTATFSDTANQLADDHGFWLSDAFASGGSVGYDHKKMGITARGAFEAVKRHFREMDIDILTTPFTVAGVGDMSGDVFGNGMLLSPAIRLVAAFDHRDIFIDPDPDLALSLAERQRLFALPRSSWADYDPARISSGGGVWSRSLKSIDLSPEMRRVLALDQPRATPQDIMAAILKAPVDLLWFGGIGTYIRAASETNADAGDRANDAIRVTAEEVRARVIGEGANLGMTQRARIAYGLAGGRCNSDAVDNSAGVNSSDVEVNIKIGLGRAVRAGRLSMEDRNNLLAEMTPDVARLVLANNYRQSLCVSLAHRRGLADFDMNRRLIQALEARGRLDRAVEFLPDDASLARREAAGQPLTRSEIGVLMAYAKLALFDDLMASDLPDDPVLKSHLTGYFPPAMRDRFAEDIAAHRLAREIIATGLSNLIVNATGPAFLARLCDVTGQPAAIGAKAILAARAIFGLDELEAAIDSLDNRLAGDVQLGLYQNVEDLLRLASLNLATDPALARDLGSLIGERQSLVTDYRTIARREARTPGEAASVVQLMAAGLDADRAAALALLARDHAALEVVGIATKAGAPMEAAVTAYRDVADLLHLDQLTAMASRLRPADRFEAQALDRGRRQLRHAHRRLAAASIHGLAAYVSRREGVIEAVARDLQALATGDATLARLTVAAGLLGDLAGQETGNPV